MMGLFDIYDMFSAIILDRNVRPSPIDNAIKTIMTVDALLTDQKAEGKKEGYSDAASEYEPIYSELEKRYTKLISDIESKRAYLNMRSNKGLAELEKLEKERDRLKAELKNRAKNVAEIFHVPVSNITFPLNSGSTCFFDSPIWDYGSYDVRDSIILRKLKERMQARKEGYMEAKAAYEAKITQLKDHYNEVKAEADAKLNDYANHISALLNEIENIKLQIADLKIAMSD